jgi:hypothetical protein
MAGRMGCLGLRLRLWLDGDLVLPLLRDSSGMSEVRLRRIE